MTTPRRDPYPTDWAQLAAGAAQFQKHIERRAREVAASRSQHDGSPKSSRAASPASTVSKGRVPLTEARPATPDI